jgi:hypothetical protein
VAASPYSSQAGAGCGEELLLVEVVDFAKSVDAQISTNTAGMNSSRGVTVANALNLL